MYLFLNFLLIIFFLGLVWIFVDFIFFLKFLKVFLLVFCFRNIFKMNINENMNKFLFYLIKCYSNVK